MTITDLARWAMEQAEGNWEEAVRLAMKRLDNEPATREEVLRPLIEVAAKSLVQLETRMERRALWAAERSLPPAELAPDAAAALHARAERLLMEYPLRGGKPLGDASRAEVRVEREFAETSSATLAQKARWFGMIERALKTDEDVVRQHITEKQLRAYQKRVMKAVA